MTLKFARTRKTLLPLFAATMLSGVALTPAMAKTLVYCSEGSPEAFDAALYSANSTWDASAETIYDRLTEFEPGTTNVVPGLAESWTISDDNLEYTLKLRDGVKFQTTDDFTPTRDFNADDVLFTYKRQLDKNDPWNSYFPGANWECSTRWTCRRSSRTSSRSMTGPSSSCSTNRMRRFPRSSR